MSILVFGAKGQIGSALIKRLGPRGIGLDSGQADFLNPVQLSSLLDRLKPDAIINAAAYTAVEKAESEAEKAHLINARAPEMIAEWATLHSVPLIHYSTDYVYDGKGNTPRKEGEGEQPLNIYGKSKLAGDHAIETAEGQYIILRTSWIYNETGRNFLTTMLKLAGEKKLLSVVHDQIGAPCYAGDIADITLKLLEKDVKPGIYHCSHQGEVSWYGFAKGIFEQLDKEVALQPLTSAEYKTMAKRPLNSRLDNEKLKKTYGLSLPHWKEGLHVCLTAMKKINPGGL